MLHVLYGDWHNFQVPAAVCKDLESNLEDLEGKLELLQSTALKKHKKLIHKTAKQMLVPHLGLHSAMVR